MNESRTAMNRAVMTTEIVSHGMASAAAIAAG
jgi:hypothetical protein